MVVSFFLVVFSNYNKFLGIILFIFLIVVMKCLMKTRKNFKIMPFINASMLSMFLVVGKIYDKAGTITILGNWSVLVKTLIYFGSLSFLLYLLIDYIYEALESKKIQKTEKKKNKALEFIFYKHPFLSISLGALGLSLFYLFFFYPGTVAFDGVWQLNSYFKNWEWNNHHPALLSMVMGNLFKLGVGLKDANLGIFLYIIIQVVINSLVMGYVFRVMNKIDTPLLLRVLSAIFFLGFPFWTINSITYIKDTIYYLVILFTFTFTYYHFGVLKKIKIIDFGVLFTLNVMLYLWRNTGVYISLINLIVLMGVFRNDKKMIRWLIIVMVGMLGVNFGYHYVFLPHYDIKEGKVREMMSIPLQQTARYVKEYPKDISLQEKKKLEVLFTGDIKDLGRIYEPNRSDNVKARILDYPTKKELKTYFRAWKSMLLKHPVVYLDATLNNIYGYFYSEHKNFMGEEVGFYNIVNYDLPEIEFRQAFEKERNMLYKWAVFLCNKPVTGLLYSCYPYVWFLICLVIYLIYKRDYKFLGILNPFLVTVLICVVSPVNGHMRYLQPVAVSIPVIIAFFIYEKNRGALG